MELDQTPNTKHLFMLRLAFPDVPQTIKVASRQAQDADGHTGSSQLRESGPEEHRLFGHPDFCGADFVPKIAGVPEKHSPPQASSSG